MRWYLFAFLCIAIGLYPITFAFVGDDVGLLSTKTAGLLADWRWRTAFYLHIIFGGLSLLVGWAQFSRRWRRMYPRAHRRVGYVYGCSVLLSGLAGCYLSFFATGGIVAQLGFFSLDMIWLVSTALAFSAIRRGDFRRHEQAMIFSYAACFAAVTLRLEMPLLMVLFQGNFDAAYRVVAWLCWAPNLVVAWFLARRVH